VTAASLDASTPSSLVVTVGAKLFRVAFNGAVEAVGPMQNSLSSYTSIAPSAVVSTAAGSAQCGSGELRDSDRDQAPSQLDASSSYFKFLRLGAPTAV
jgi:hypothetical protein